ncbi:MAG: sodium-dependent transporter [Bacteroides sp.]|nr:sodium-dependent transporter [Bacteroides sp.]
MAKKVKFGSRIGLIAATVGSAVGLGNVWRFPAEAQTNGGAAFLLLYVICVCLLGIPVMIAEFSLGRGTQSDAVGAFRKLSPKKKWWLTGALAIFASYLILSFYMVVAGWTLEYFWQSVTGQLYAHLNSPDGMVSSFREKMAECITGSWRPLIVTYIMIAVNLLVLMKGVQKGIEKMSNLMMPLLFVLLLGFACVAMTFPKSMEGLAFFLNPDFSKITPTVMINALGQAFFSLSLGMGILITYAGYFPKETNLLSTSVTVAGLDMLVALLMGFIIFPAVMSFGLDGESLEGATLVFVTLPEVFVQLPLTQLWSALFFLLLMVAALTSTISLAEVSIAFLQDYFGLHRVKACLWVMLPLTVVSTLCSLSQGVLSDFRIFGFNLFDFLDNTATNIMLPVAAIFTCLFVGWAVPKEFIRKELTNNGKMNTSFVTPVVFIVRYVAPALIALILIARFV